MQVGFFKLAEIIDEEKAIKLLEGSVYFNIKFYKINYQKKLFQ